MHAPQPTALSPKRPAAPVIDATTLRYDASDRLRRSVGLPPHSDEPVESGGTVVTRVATPAEMAAVLDAIAAADEVAADKWAVRKTRPPQVGGVRTTHSDLVHAARRNGEVVGFLFSRPFTEADLGSPDPTFGYVVGAEFAYVVPSARGAGVGRLMARALSVQVGRDVADIARRLAALGFDGTLRCEADGCARTAGGVALLDAVSAGLVAGVAACGHLPFPVRCVRQRFEVVAAEDDYRID